MIYNILLVVKKYHIRQFFRIAREGRGARTTRRGYGGKKQFAAEVNKIPLF